MLLICILDIGIGIQNIVNNLKFYKYLHIPITKMIDSLNLYRKCIINHYHFLYKLGNGRIEKENYYVISAF